MTEQGIRTALWFVWMVAVIAFDLWLGYEAVAVCVLTRWDAYTCLCYTV